MMMKKSRLLRSASERALDYRNWKRDREFEVAADRLMERLMLLHLIWGPETDPEQLQRLEHIRRSLDNAGIVLPEDREERLKRLRELEAGSRDTRVARIAAGSMIP